MSNRLAHLDFKPFSKVLYRCFKPEENSSFTLSSVAVYLAKTFQLRTFCVDLNLTASYHSVKLIEAAAPDFAIVTKRIKAQRAQNFRV